MSGRKKEREYLEELTYILSHQLGKIEHLLSWLSHCCIEEEIQTENLKKEKVGILLQHLNKMYCKRCSKREMCQKKIEMAMLQKGFLEEEDILSFLTCHGGEDMIREANRIYQRGLQEIMLEQQRQVHQNFLGKQYRAAAKIIQECRSCWDEQSDKEEALDDSIRKKARSYGIEILKCLTRKEEGYLEILLCLRTKKGEKTSREIGRILSEIYQKKMRPMPRCRSIAGDKFIWMEFVEEPRFYALSGAVRAAKAGETQCGEQFALENIREDCFVAAICDGLGTGPVAGRESKRVIELLEKLLESDIDPETALEMVKSSMLFSTWNERYVTLDYFMVNLHTGIGKILKLGAAETFIIRGRMIEVVEGDSPPVGVFMNSDTSFIRKKFNHGDKIVMVSDGVLDEIGGKEVFIQFLKMQKENCPQRLCDLIMEKITNRKDDCTVLAIGIWNK
ncbi:MAG: SpoIIE family protein phosphatase [Lachnospiraceae bacterium]|nr:SpoIIE family protein phosphatase [Lachnospiraceae bacterium]